MKNFYESIKKKFTSLESILKIVRSTKNHFKDMSISFSKCSERIKDSNNFENYENVFEITNKLLDKLISINQTLEVNYCNISKDIMIIHDNLKLTSNSLKLKLEELALEIEHLRKLENLENSYNKMKKQ